MVDISLIKNKTKSKTFKAGTVIIDAGSNTGDMYIILKGTVGAYSNYKKTTEAELYVFGEGDAIGERPPDSESKVILTYVAKAEVTVLQISRADFKRFMSEEADFSYDLIRYMCARFEMILVDYAMHSRKVWHPPAKPATAEKKEEVKTVVEVQETAAPEPEEPSEISPLFPAGHSNKGLPIDNTKMDYFLMKSYVCPCCKKEFKSMKIRSSRLYNVKTDADLRIHYKDVEPMYYEVLSCPNCLYSAPDDVFEKGKKNNTELMDLIKPFKDTIIIKEGEERDAMTVFAGYHLALICVPKSIPGHQLITAKLLQKLSRIYGDCGNKKLETEMAAKALEAYTNIYERLRLEPAQSPQICVMIGELSIKMGDLKKARDYFFKAKTDKITSPTLKRHSEDRLEDIRLLMAEEQEA